eukprot:153703_1
MTRKVITINNNKNKKKKLTFVSFEGSFETEPNHNHELFIILGNGLLLCRWSQTKQNKLKFVNFYSWKSFFSISNKSGTKKLICTFKLEEKQQNNRGRGRGQSQSDSFNHLLESRSTIGSHSHLNNNNLS